MAISLHCESCSARFQVSDRLAGKPVRCPLCNRAVEVPAATAAVHSGGGDFESELDALVQAERESDAVYEPLTLKCPSCGEEVETTTEFLGQNVQCAGCGKKFRLRRPQQRHTEDHHSDNVPSWIDDEANRLTRRYEDEQHGRTFSAADPVWSKVLSGLDRISLGLWIQAGVAGLNTALVVATLVGGFVLFASVGAGLLMDISYGGSGSGTGSFAFGWMIMMFGAIVWLFLQISFMLDRFREGLLGLVGFLFLVAIIAATRGIGLIVILVLEIPVVLAALALMLFGAFQCRAMPRKANVGRAIVACIGTTGGAVAATILAIAAGITLFWNPPSEGIGLSVRLAVLMASSCVAVANGMLAWVLQGFGRFSQNKELQSQSEMCLWLQLAFGLCGLLMLPAGNVLAALAVVTLMSVVYLVDVISLTRLVDRARCLIR